jgi:hypothetical protein
MDLLDAPLDKERFADITERPLFLPDRRPPKEEPEEEEEIPEQATGAALDTMDLTAIIITPTESVAWVRSPSKPAPERLRLGDELEGWTVKAIKEDEIEVERQGESDTLVLRDYSKSPPPAARPPGRAARAPNPARRGVQRPGPVGRAANPPRPGVRQPRTSNDAQPRR